MKSIVEDIFELRKEKLTRILKNVEPAAPLKFLTNIGSIELNYVRPAFSAAYTVAGKMQDIIEHCTKAVEENGLQRQHD